MTQSGSLKRALGVVLFAMAMAWPALASAEVRPSVPTAVTSFFSVDEDVGQARIVGAHRAKAPSAYRWREDRNSDLSSDWTATAITNVVRVDVEIADRSVHVFDDTNAVSTITLTLDPRMLTSEQSAALSRGRMSERARVFYVTATPRTHMVRRIDYARSQLCDTDAMRCEEQLVYVDAPEETVDVSVA